METRRTDARRTRGTGLLLALTLLTAWGCKAVDPDPFGKFSSSVQELRTGADAALSINDEANRTRFLDETTAEIASPDDDLSSAAKRNLLLTQSDGDPFGWQMERPPLYLTSRRFRSGAYALNSAIVAYSELLKTLASKELIRTGQFDSLATDLNAHLNAAADRMGVKDPAKPVGMFSAAASTAFHAYIENRRRGALRDALRKNQDNVEQISELFQRGVRIAARNVRTNYDEESIRLDDQITESRRNGGADLRERVEALVEANEAYVTRLAALEALHDAYGLLPTAHRQLSEAVVDPSFNLSTVNELFLSGKHLYGLYQELSESTSD